MNFYKEEFSDAQKLIVDSFALSFYCMFIFCDAEDVVDIPA